LLSSGAACGVSGRPTGSNACYYGADLAARPGRQDGRSPRRRTELDARIPTSCQGEGRGFESRRPLQKWACLACLLRTNPNISGSSEKSGLRHVGQQGAKAACTPNETSGAVGWAAPGHSVAPPTASSERQKTRGCAVVHLAQIPRGSPNLARVSRRPAPGRRTGTDFCLRLLHGH